ncbi:hypothetical protein SCHPADRAFT_947857 [Schizopora paradoxa]|uniref:Uncharacterized protein n=1 Tax=Schizopora paradoxa TaxID=27342 RepID=A0A0H2QXY2_9AGAM|nr:hypothetical protein SCHPADRAFT_947857 [Schizopora paradoxa]
MGTKRAQSAKRPRGRPPKNPPKACYSEEDELEVVHVVERQSRSKRSKAVPSRFKDAVVDGEEMDVDTEEEVVQKPPAGKAVARDGGRGCRAAKAVSPPQSGVSSVVSNVENEAVAEKAVRDLLGAEDRVKKAPAKKKQNAAAEVAMDIDSDSGDSTQEEPETMVIFKVPQKNGCLDTVEIPSSISYDSFKFKIAEGMDISVKKLNIGYTLSTWPQKEMPFSLSKVSHLVGLFETVEKERVRLEKAAKKGNNAKDLFVKIKDLNEQKGGKGKGGTAKKGKSKAVEENVEGDTNSGSDVEKSEPPKKLSAAWAIEMEAALKCDKEGKDVCKYGKCWKEVIAETGEVKHHSINPRDSSFWLLNLSMEKWDSVLTPPDSIAKRIKAEEAQAEADAAAAALKTPKDSVSQTGPSSTGSTVSSQSFPNLPFQMPAIHFHAGALMNGTGTYMASPSKSVFKKPPSSDHDRAGSGYRLDAVPVKSFTAIREFLATVDQEEAEGGDNPNFSQFADQFIEKGYRRIHLLYDETPKTLQVDLGIPVTTGDAKQLLMYVKRACEAIARAN